MADRLLLKRCLTTIVVCVIVVASNSNGYRSKVTTRFGQVQGLWSRSSRGRLVAHYLGIPYAEPPVGNLRFRSPEPWNHTWTDTYEATKNGPMCIQLDTNNRTIGNEDCLYLNIYRPMVSEKREGTGLLPVMVFVHGGSYAAGSGDSRKLPPDYLMDQDVILVTMNYRLNILGFFSTGSKASPGNYGLKDIVLALHWIQENIESFDGDRNSITLWGHSAGAAAVHTLALNNKTEGLFNRYILQSGSAFCPWALNSKNWMRRMALQTAKLLGCLPEEKAEKVISTEQPEVSNEEYSVEEEEYNEKQEEEMMSCLRNVDTWKFGRVVSYYNVWKGNPCCTFAPTIEEESKDAILTMHPINVIKNRLFRDIPFIMGVVHDEGLVKSIGVLTDRETEDELINNFEMYLPYVTEYYQLISNKSDFVDAIEEFYFDGNVSSTLTQNITEAISDSLFLWPAYQVLKHQSELMNSSIYFYLFSYQGTFSSTFSSGIPIHYGVSHSDDLNYLIPLLNQKHKDQMLHNTENDVTVINIMTEMFASFAANGVPQAWRMPTWPSYKDSREFLKFGIEDNPEATIGNEFFPERMNFWEELTNITLNAIEPHTIPQHLIRNDEIEFNNSISNKCNQILSCLLIFLVVCSS